MARSAQASDVFVIDASAVHRYIPAREIWQHRELLSLLIRRYVSSRYRQMALGGLWAVLEPLAQLLLLSIVFGLLLRIDTQGYPYAVYAFAGLVPWWLFSRVAMSVAGCLQDNMGLISKVYFPRLLLAVAVAARELLDSLVSFALLLLVSAFFGFYPATRLLLAPIVLLLVCLAGCSIGLWVAAVMVKFRDVRPGLGVALQAGMYFTPIIYSASLVPEKIRFLYELNPMYWAVETFRWMLLDQPLSLTPAFGLSAVLVAGLFVSGLRIFSLQERLTVDVQ